MNKSRLEAFSDGVFAIIITIMVLEIKVPHGEDWSALKPLLPQLISYVISFSYVAIYWMNHHHLVQTLNKVTTPILWSNIFLLFWLSLVPVATDWMGESHFAAHPVATYALLLFTSGIAYSIFGLHIEKRNKSPEKFAQAFSGLKRKSIVSLFCYAVAFIFAFINTTISCFLFLLVAIMWFIPDKKIENVLSGE
jgi:uncharacterized membrane protein